MSWSLDAALALELGRYHLPIELVGVDDWLAAPRVEPEPEFGLGRAAVEAGRKLPVLPRPEEDPVEAIPADRLRRRSEYVYLPQLAHGEISDEATVRRPERIQRVLGTWNEMTVGFIQASQRFASGTETFKNLVSIYESDFGVCRVVLSRYVPADTVLFLDSSRVSVVPLSATAVIGSAGTLTVMLTVAVELSPWPSVAV